MIRLYWGQSKFQRLCQPQPNELKEVLNKNLSRTCYGYTNLSLNSQQIKWGAQYMLSYWEGSVQVAESDVPNGSAQATLVMSSLRDGAHTFVNSFFSGTLVFRNLTALINSSCIISFLFCIFLRSDCRWTRSLWRYNLSTCLRDHSCMEFNTHHKFNKRLKEPDQGSWSSSGTACNQGISELE